MVTQTVVELTRALQERKGRDQARSENPSQRLYPYCCCTSEVEREKRKALLEFFQVTRARWCFCLKLTVSVPGHLELLILTVELRFVE